MRGQFMRGQLFVAALLAGSLAGCSAEPRRVTVAHDIDHAEHADAVRSAPVAHSDAAGQAPQDTSAAQAIVSPVNERELARRAAWAAAIEGLSFESGVLEVTQPLPRDVEYATSMIARGWQQLEVNHRVEAVADFASAVRSQTDRREAYMGLGHALKTRGKYDLAASTFRAAIALDEGDVEARAALAGMLGMIGDRSAAIIEMNEALRVDPDYGPAHERLAVWMYYEGDIPAARQHARAAAKAGTPVPPQLLDLMRTQ